MVILDRLKPEAALLNLLAREEKAILAGDFDTLERLFEQKQMLLARVARARLPEASLQALSRRSERNNRLLAASARGINKAREELARLRKGPQRFSTYGPRGGSNQLGHKSLTIKRKV